LNASKQYYFDSTLVTHFQGFFYHF